MAVDEIESNLHQCFSIKLLLIMEVAVISFLIINLDLYQFDDSQE